MNVVVLVNIVDHLLDRPYYFEGHTALTLVAQEVLSTCEILPTYTDMLSIFIEIAGCRSLVWRLARTPFLL
jgi:hypothetical protein